MSFINGGSCKIRKMRRSALVSRLIRYLKNELCNYPNKVFIISSMTAVLFSALGSNPSFATTLGVDGARFTINGKPQFMLGISYFSALGIDAKATHGDIDQMHKLGFNWMRVWALWPAFGKNITAFKPDGSPMQPYMNRLKELLQYCDKRGMVVDITMAHGATFDGQPCLPTFEDYLSSIRTLATDLKKYRNWYLDMANEHDIRDARYVSYEDLRKLRDAVKQIDPKRIVTASGGGMDEASLHIALVTAGLDFIAPHLPRQAGSAEQTESITRNCLSVMSKMGHVVPILYQEPFRRDYGNWQPGLNDFLTDAIGAKSVGAAGWCFHNGSNKHAKDGRPRRSFDLRDGPLFSQLDSVEKNLVNQLAGKLASTTWGSP